MKSILRSVRNLFIAASFTGLTMAAHAQVYKVTISDLTTGQPFSPPVIITHDASVSLWNAGDPASNGIQQIAESGNRGPLVNTLTPLVGSSILDMKTPLTSPLLPGSSVSVFVNADAAHPFLSSAWMLGKTNDSFSGELAIDLLNISGTQTFDVFALDAGTEVNTELAADLIAFGGSGHVAENGVVHLSTGLRGIDHITNGLGYDVNGVRTDSPASWRWDNSSPVARVTVTAIPEPGSIALMLGILVPSGLLIVRRGASKSPKSN